MDAPVLRKKFEFYDTDGQVITTKHDPRHFPEAWLPAKIKGSPKKKSAKNANMVFVFTTSDLSMKKSKWIEGVNGWNATKIGDQFWLKSGERVNVVEDSKIDRKKWSAVFDGQNSYKKCGALFAELSLEDQKEFSEIPVNCQIRYLKVPQKAQKNFRDGRWGLLPLQKYCDAVANQVERRREEQRKKYDVDCAKRLEEFEKANRLRAAERDDTLGALDGLDSVYVRTGCKAELQYVVNDEDRVAGLMLGAIYEDLGDQNLDRLPEKCKARRPMTVDRISVKVTGNDHRRDFNLLLSLIKARGEGVINKDILPLISAFYEWRYNNILHV
jgi:hypothetical protein